MRGLVVWMFKSVCITETVNENLVWEMQTAFSLVFCSLFFIFYLPIIRNNDHASLEIESCICSAAEKE